MPGNKQSQISGAGKDAFIERAVREVEGLEPELAVQIAEHLSEVIKTVKADRDIIERYKAPLFDPDAFSLIKIYRVSGEGGLKQKLAGIFESEHLVALAKAQQISLPRDLRGGGASPVDLRQAIIKGVKARIADREAAS